MEEKDRQNSFWNAKLPIEERLDWLLAKYDTGRKDNMHGFNYACAAAFWN